MAVPSMPVPALQPHQQHQSPFQLHFYGFQRVVNRARNYLNNVGPTVPNVYNLPDVRFDEGAALWVEKSPPIKGGGFYEIRPTESKMKLIEESLKCSTASFEAILIGAPAVTYTITPNLNAMLNHDNLFVYQLADLDGQGRPWNLICLMIACQGNATWNKLAQAVWKTALAFVWAVLKQQLNPDAPIGNYVALLRHEGRMADESRNRTAKVHGDNVMANMPGQSTLVQAHVAQQLASVDGHFNPPPPPVAPCPIPPPAPSYGYGGMIRVWDPVLKCYVLK